MSCWVIHLQISWHIYSWHNLYCPSYNFIKNLKKKYSNIQKPFFSAMLFYKCSKMNQWETNDNCICSTTLLGCLCLCLPRELSSTVFSVPQLIKSTMVLGRLWMQFSFNKRNKETAVDIEFYIERWIKQPRGAGSLLMLNAHWDKIKNLKHQ